VHTKSRAALQRALGKKAKLDGGRLHVPSDPDPQRLAEVLAEVEVVDLVLGFVSAAWWKSANKIAGLERLTRLAMLSWDTKQVQLVRGLAKVSLPQLQELRIGLLGDGAMSTLGALELPALHHLAIGGGGYGVRLTAKGVRALAASPLGKQLVTLELGRCEITPAIASLVTRMKRLERFAASYGEVDATESALRERFGRGFVIEDEPSFDYLLLGVRGISRSR